MNSKIHFVISLTICGAVFLSAGVRARAQDRGACSIRIRQDRRELDRAIDQYGYDSRQAKHERTELDRDAANCGYDAYDRRDWRYGNGRGTEHRNYNGQNDRYNPAFDNGYRDGIAIGQRDAQKGKPFNPRKNDRYEDADRGYNRKFGDKNLYRSQYREAFERGYNEGYNRWH